MKKSNLLQLCVVLALVFIAGTLIGPAASNPSTADWQTTLQRRLPLYGHRNWIVVSDAAFPAYSQSGIETIVVDQDLPSVLNSAAKAISSSKHVRAAAFVDQELKFVPEEDYPGSRICERKSTAHSERAACRVSRTPRPYPRLTTREKLFVSCSSRQTRQYRTPLYSCAWIAVT